MADDDGTQLVHLRHKQTQGVIEVPRNAVPGFPDYEELRSDGTRKPTTQTPKEG